MGHLIFTIFFSENKDSLFVYLQQVVLGHVSGQDVLQEDLVDAAHSVNALLLARQLRAPKEV